MKLTLLVSFISLAFIGCTSAQDNNNNKTMKEFEYSLKTAHPKAQALMAEDFYWSSIEETGPFGSDDGWDAAYSFRQWRISHQSANSITYLKELITRWDYPFFDWNEMDTSKILAYIVSRADIDEQSIQQQIQQLKEASKNSPDTSMKNLDDEQWREIIKSSSKEMGGVFLLGQDNAIIGTGFAQFALEGRIDDDVKALTITAIKRQLLPVLLNRYDEDYRIKRKEQLTKMLQVVNKINL